MDQFDEVQMTMAGRLKEARSRKYPSAAAAARALGINEVTLRAHESGQNGIPADMAIIYCRAYGIDPNWLMRGHRPTELRYDKFSGIRLQVSGEVARGVYRDASLPPSPPYGELQFPNADSFFGIEVFEVTSDAWEPDVTQGSFLVCNRASGVQIRVDDLVVVERDRGGLVETSIKTISKVRDIIYLKDSNFKPEAFIALTGEEASNEYKIRAVVKEIVTRVPRPPLSAAIWESLPTVEHPDEPI